MPSHSLYDNLKLLLHWALALSLLPLHQIHSFHPFLHYMVDGKCAIPFAGLQKYEFQTTATLLLCLVGADVHVLHVNVFLYVHIE